jgi:hypothetical protein
VDLVGTRDPDVPLVAVEELLKWDGIDAVISLGIVGRHELAQLLLRSMQEVDPSVTPALASQIESLAREYERSYIARIAELMEMYEKPVIGVTLTGTQEGTVRRVEGRRYSPVFFQTPEDAVNALARMVAYHEFKAGA